MISKIRRNPWPYAIVGYFIVFISAMACWITYAVRNDMELERADYYDHEVRYQAQIDRATRTASIRNEVSVTYKPDQMNLTIALPRDHRRPDTTGELHLYRPSDSRLDQRFPLALGESGVQILNVSDLQRGLWKLRLSWTANGSEYYFDQPLVIASN